MNFSDIQNWINYKILYIEFSKSKIYSIINNWTKTFQAFNKKQEIEQCKQQFFINKYKYV